MNNEEKNQHDLCT